MRDLAAELGIGRATLYRWVGSRERLLGEILWSLAELGLKEAVESTSANGVARVLHVYERLLRLTAAHTPTRRFVENEPEAALRILMSREGVQQGRLIQALQGMLEDAEADGNLRLRLDAADLAYVMVRIAESFIWREFITGEEPDLSTPVAVVRLLLG
jgi:AcrR family transcriptional regulator